MDSLSLLTFMPFIFGVHAVDQSSRIPGCTDACHSPDVSEISAPPPVVVINLQEAIKRIIKDLSVDSTQRVISFLNPASISAFQQTCRRNGDISRPLMDARKRDELNAIRRDYYQLLNNTRLSREDILYSFVDFTVPKQKHCDFNRFMVRFDAKVLGRCSLSNGAASYLLFKVHSYGEPACLTRKCISNRKKCKAFQFENGSITDCHYYDGNQDGRWETIGGIINNGIGIVELSKQIECLFNKRSGHFGGEHFPAFIIRQDVSSSERLYFYMDSCVSRKCCYLSYSFLLMMGVIFLWICLMRHSDFAMDTLSPTQSPSM